MEGEQFSCNLIQFVESLRRRSPGYDRFLAAIVTSSQILTMRRWYGRRREQLANLIAHKRNNRRDFRGDNRARVRNFARRGETGSSRPRSYDCITAVQLQQSSVYSTA